MINIELYKQETKANYKIFLIFSIITIIYTSLIIGMYNETQINSLKELYNTMPELMAAFGMTGMDTTLLEFLITYLYGFLYLVLPMVITIIIANKLVARHTDKGSMAQLLASPNSRTKVVLTQIKVLLTFIFITILFITISEIIAISINFPNELDIGKLICMNIGLLALHFAISGVCFLASCIFNETKNSLLIGAGIPTLFFLIQMISNIGNKLSNIKYLSIFTLFNPREILSDTFESYIMIVSLFIIGIILYAISLIVFKRKDFPI